MNKINYRATCVSHTNPLAEMFTLPALSNWIVRDCVKKSEITADFARRLCSTSIRTGEQFPSLQKRKKHPIYGFNLY